MAESLDWIYVLHQFFGYAFQTIPILLVCYAPFSKEEFRFDRKKVMFLSIVFLLICSLLFSLFLGYHYGPTTVANEGTVMEMAAVSNHLFRAMLVVMIIYYFLSFSKKVRGRIFGFIVGVQYALVSYMMAQITSKLPALREMGFQEYYVPYGTDALLTYMGMAFFIFPMYYFFLKKVDIRKLRIQNPRNIQWLTLYSLMILTLYILTLSMVQYIYMTHVDSKFTVLMIAWIIGMLLVAVFVYFMFFFVLRIEREKGELQSQMTAFDLQYQTMNDKMQEEKQRNHDTRHHFRMLISLMEHGEYEHVEKYLREYAKEWNQANEQAISNNANFDRILNHYLSQAKLKGIQVIHDVLIKDVLPFDGMDLTVLFGNALENAIEACENKEVNDPWIQLNICQKQKMLLIQIKNSCDTAPLKVNEKNQLPFSSKRKRKTGYGISSMMQVAKKYQGNMEYWKKEGIFTVRILLVIPDEK